MHYHVCPLVARSQIIESLECVQCHLREMSGMSENDKNTSETETILMALDQISQTIDVMTSVVGRLRNYIQQKESSTVTTNAVEQNERVPVDKVLH